MNTPTISIISAVAENLAIGKNNQLLWHIPEDLQHFKKLTTGHPIIMGERTFHSIGKTLPNRTNIILSDRMDLLIDGAIVCHSFEEALEKAKETNPAEIFIIGGGSVYRQALPMADKLYLTIVEGEYEADTFFPEYEHLFTKKISEVTHENYHFRFKFVELLKG
jgi:dihydrofolate reductase